MCTIGCYTSCNSALPTDLGALPTDFGSGLSGFGVGFVGGERVKVKGGWWWKFGCLRQNNFSHFLLFNN